MIPRGVGFGASSSFWGIIKNNHLVQGKQTVVPVLAMYVLMYKELPVTN